MIVSLATTRPTLVRGGFGFFVFLQRRPRKPPLSFAGISACPGLPALRQYGRLHDLPEARRGIFGKTIRDWRTHRAISRRGKIASVLAMVLSLAASLALAVDPVIFGLQALALSCAAVFILTRNTAT